MDLIKIFNIEIMRLDEEFEIVNAINKFNEYGLEFNDFWEMDDRRYLYRYIWLCYAIVWGIKKFDEVIK